MKRDMFDELMEGINDLKQQRKRKPVACCCDGYWFPHRRKSKWCIFNEVEKSQEEIEEREEGLAYALGRKRRK